MSHHLTPVSPVLPPSQMYLLTSFYCWPFCPMFIVLWMESSKSLTSRLDTVKISVNPIYQTNVGGLTLTFGGIRPAYKQDLENYFLGNSGVICEVTAWRSYSWDYYCRFLKMGIGDEFIAPEKLINLLRSLAWIEVEDLAQLCCSSDWTCNTMKSFSLCCPRQRPKCSSVKQSLFMSKEHLFLGKNGLFVSGKRDVFLWWWCFSPPLSPGNWNLSIVCASSWAHGAQTSA